MNKVFAILLGVLLFSLHAPLKAEDQAGMDYWNGIEHEAIQTESGLQYKILINGKGRPPNPNNKVLVHYRGLFLNGVTFDSSFNQEEPIKISLKKVIKGWKEGIQLMPIGSVFVFLIPPDLAYGEKGTSTIPPNSTLIFEVELFGVK